MDNVIKELGKAIKDAHEVCEKAMDRMAKAEEQVLVLKAANKRLRQALLDLKVSPEMVRAFEAGSRYV